MFSYEGFEYKIVKVNVKIVCYVVLFFFFSLDNLCCLFCIVNGMFEKYVICYIMGLVFLCLYLCCRGFGFVMFVDLFVVEFVLKVGLYDFDYKKV